MYARRQIRNGNPWGEAAEIEDSWNIQTQWKFQSLSSRNVALEYLKTLL